MCGLYNNTELVVYLKWICSAETGMGSRGTCSRRFIAISISDFENLAIDQHIVRAYLNLKIELTSNELVDGFGIFSCFQLFQ